MEKIDQLTRLLRNTPFNAFFGWFMVLLLILMGAVNLTDGRLTWFALIVFVISIIIAPALILRDISVMPSWYFVILAILPILGSTTAYHLFLTGIPVYFSVATIAMLFVAELSWFTSVRMGNRFAVLLVIITTLAMSGFWHLLQWAFDVYLGTTFLLDARTPEQINDAVMYEFIYATIAGIAAGYFFGWYLKNSRHGSKVQMPIKEHAKEEEHPISKPPSFIRKFLGISDKSQRYAIISMQAGLLLMIIIGILKKDLSTTTNATTGLAISFVPFIITRKFNIKYDTGLVLWLTLAIFLHAAGTLVFYDNIARWDNITHALSASVVAAAGYTLIRAIDIYVDEIYIPPKVLFILLLLFVMATGVVWEIIEFISDEVTAALGFQAILAQHGIHDTMVDLIFDMVGAIMVAAWGTAYLSKISYKLAAMFDDMDKKKVSKK